MADDENLEEERQRLFAMVWERPAREVAKELGISDMALGKQCRRLQVPKPPRGYWARVAAGRMPRRPPLPAYRSEVAERFRKDGLPGKCSESFYISVENDMEPEMKGR